MRSAVKLVTRTFLNVLLMLAAYAMFASAFVPVVEGALWFIGLRVQLSAPNWGNAFAQPLRDKELARHVTGRRRPLRSSSVS